MIEVEHLTKRFGEITAVDDLSFQAPDGTVTGFLGPNGAGKTTTMRMVLDLDKPTAGWARVDGKPLRAHRSPLRAVGALLNAGSAAPGMTARAHLRWVARAGAIPNRRVEEVLELVGLSSVPTRRIGALSLGMRQRLGLATAMLGDPRTYILDEPINGLDPEGVLWVRTLLKDLAAQGRAVLISSHLMSEMQLTADRVVVIGKGRLMADLSMSSLENTVERAPIRLRAADPQRLLAALQRQQRDMRVERLDNSPGGEAWRITGPTAEEIGDAAVATGIAIYELTPQRTTLEEVFFRLTHEATEYTSASADHREQRIEAAK